MTWNGDRILTEFHGAFAQIIIALIQFRPMINEGIRGTPEYRAQTAHELPLFPA
jgi:hypothetical protein